MSRQTAQPGATVPMPSVPGTPCIFTCLTEWLPLAYWMLGLFSRFYLAFGKSQKYVPHVLSQYDLQDKAYGTFRKNDHCCLLWCFFVTCSALCYQQAGARAMPPLAGVWKLSTPRVTGSALMSISVPVALALQVYQPQPRVGPGGIACSAFQLAKAHWSHFDRASSSQDA
jgi:hypothetical protein